MKKSPQTILLLLVVLFLIPGATATTLGVNYYHESLVSERWGVPYINVGIEQVKQDFDHIKEISSHIKFYMNPFVDKNLPWIKTISAEAKNRGFYVVVNMMVDDRDLHDGNWGTYRNKVLTACTELNGKVDSILVGNEISLHSPWDKYTVRQKVEPLINECKQRFNGEVTYEAFWYEKEAWYSYNGPLYFMQYENLNSFTTNVEEMQDKFGSNAYIGEWGEDSIDEGIEKDDWWQRQEIEKRWKVIEKTQAPVAYIFAYREPSWNAFGIINPAGQERPVWDYLKSLGGGSTYNPPPTEPTPTTSNSIGDLTPVCMHNGNTCNKISDVTSGSCRTVTWSTNGGTIKVQGCEKGGGYVEIYRQSSPSGDWAACLNNGCVSDNNGFARFIPTTTEQPPTEPEQPPTEPEQPEQPPTTYEGIQSLPLSCTREGTACNKISDVTSGTCRTVTWNTAGGTTKIQGCEKGGGYIELYTQTSPSGKWEACFGNGCIGHYTGFTRFIPTTEQPPTEPEQPPTEPEQPPEEPTTTYDGTIQSLNTNCEQNGNTCNKKADSTSGTCRTVTWNTNYGDLQVKACKKSDGYIELYKQNNPGGDYKACFETGCITDGNGFARFKP